MDFVKRLSVAQDELDDILVAIRFPSWILDLSKIFFTTLCNISADFERILMKFWTSRMSLRPSD